MLKITPILESSCPPTSGGQLISGTSPSAQIQPLASAVETCIFVRVCRRTAYISLVRPTLEYACEVWDPHHKTDIDRLERVQNAAARFVVRDYRTREQGFMTNTLRELGLPSLEERRQQARLRLLGRIVNEEIPALPPKTFLTPVKQNQRAIRARSYKDCVSENPIQRHQMLNNKCFKVPDSKTANFRNSFFIRTVTEWNGTPSDSVVPSASF